MSTVLYSRVPEAYSRNPGHLESGEEFNDMVQVFGGMQQAGGFKEAFKKHRDHHDAQGKELLNIAEGLDKDDPRPAYIPQQFPKMIYTATDEKIVLHEAELAEALKAGWREEPFIKPQIAVFDPATEKQNLVDVNNRLQAQIIQQHEAMAKQTEAFAEMQKQMAEFMAKSKK